MFLQLYLLSRLLLLTGQVIQKRKKVIFLFKTNYQEFECIVFCFFLLLLLVMMMESELLTFFGDEENLPFPLNSRGPVLPPPSLSHSITHFFLLCLHTLFSSSTFPKKLTGFTFPLVLSSRILYHTNTDWFPERNSIFVSHTFPN